MKEKRSARAAAAPKRSSDCENPGAKAPSIAAILAGICGLAGLAGAAVTEYAYDKAFRANRKLQADNEDFPVKCTEDELSVMRGLVRDFTAIPCEDVYITSDDGLRLHGRYYHVADGAPLEIQFHGYNSNAIRDFCGGNELGRRAGHNSLVVDQRAHGESEGRTITFGIKERYDCRRWVEYAVERFGSDVKIILAGVSMGAATVMMAMELELPDNVKCVVADCGYSSPEAIIKKVCKDRRLPAAVYPFIRLAARVRGGFDLEESSAAEAVKHTDIPLLLIHGEADEFVPCSMSREIYEACASPKMLFTVPGAGHGLSYIVDCDSYGKTVKEFTEKYL